MIPAGLAVLAASLLCGPALLRAGHGSEAGGWHAGEDDEPQRKKKGAAAGDAEKPAESKPSSGGVDMSDVPPDKKAEKKDRAALGETFKLKRTAHYSVLYDTNEADLKVFAAAIEKTYRSCVNYTQKLGFEAHAPKRKLIIYYFEHHEDYSAFAEKLGKGAQPQTTPGVYFPDLNRSMFYNFRNHESFKQAREEAEAKIAQLRDQLRQPGLSAADRKRIGQEISDARRQANHSNTAGGDISESIVQHEVAHQVLWNIGFHNEKQFFANPRWLAEGTAMMFEPISTGNSSNFGRLNRDRLREYQAARDANRLIPLREFVSTHAHFGPQSIDIAYPQSWALVHYLNRTKRAKVKAYAEAINKRPADYQSTPEREIADFEASFGKIDKKWVENWENWMRRVR